MALTATATAATAPPDRARAPLPAPPHTAPRPFPSMRHNSTRPRDPGACRRPEDPHIGPVDTLALLGGRLVAKFGHDQRRRGFPIGAAHHEHHAVQVAPVYVHRLVLQFLRHVGDRYLAGLGEL